MQATSSYVVLKPLRGADGRTLAAGQSIDLTARQAKWLLLSGKVARAASATEPKTKAVRRVAAAKEE